MNPESKSKLKLIGSIVVVVILGSVIFRQCSNHPLPTIIRDSKAIVDSFKSIISRYEVEVKSAKDSVIIYRGITDSTTRKLAAIQAKLTKEQRKVLNLAMDVTSTKKIQDTTEHDKKCDTLAERAILLTVDLESYKDEVDSLHLAHLNERESVDLTINKMQAFNSDMRNSFSQMQGINNSLIIENQRLNKKVKKEKLLTRVLAIVGTIGIGALIVK